MVVDPVVFEKLLDDAEDALDRAELALDLLADNPRPPSCVAVQGEDSVFQVRVGDYRIGHRREVYL